MDADRAAGHPGGLGAGDDVRSDAFAAAAHRTMGTRLTGAELYRVSTDMARTAMDASQDCPAHLEADMPSPAGLIAFADPLPPFTVADGLYLRDGDRTDILHTDPVPVDALVWFRDDRGLEIHLCCTPTRRPLPLFATPTPLTPFTRFQLPTATVNFESVTTTTSVVLDNDGHPMLGATTALGPLALLSTIWVLMMTPTVAARDTFAVTAGPGKKARNRVSGDVTLIDLRPAKHHTPPSASSDRHLSTRHRVRGHWKNQAHGPARAHRKIIWVPDYIRGPEGAPSSAPNASTSGAAKSVGRVERILVVLTVVFNGWPGGE